MKPAKSKSSQPALSRRERQMMDILYRRGRASALEIHGALPDRPSYSAVRAKLRVLEEKGHVQHAVEGTKYVYSPRVAIDRARRSALRHMVDTFFDGSVEQVVAALLDRSALEVKPGELERLRAMIEEAQQDGR
jgi:predicted transcriptional regulator